LLIGDGKVSRDPALAFTAHIIDFLDPALSVKAPSEII
jgi:hypothetical protein